MSSPKHVNYIPITNHKSGTHDDLRVTIYSDEYCFGSGYKLISNPETQIMPFTEVTQRLVHGHEKATVELVRNSKRVMDGAYYDLEPSWGIGFFLGSDFIRTALGVALASTLLAGLLVYALKKWKDRTCDNHIFLGATLISIPLMLLTLVSVPVPNNQVQEYKNARTCHTISTYSVRMVYENGECVTQRNIQYVTQHIKVEEKSRNPIRRDSKRGHVVGQEYTIAENKVFEGKEYKPGDTIFIPLEKITGGEYDTFHINPESNKNSDHEKNSGHDYKYLGSIEDYKYKGAYEITGLNHIEINGTTYDSVNEQNKTLYVDHEIVTGKK